MPGCYLLEVSAPTKPGTVDRFVARSAEVVAKWVEWALTGRNPVARQALLELALSGALVVRARALGDTSASEWVDLRRELSAVPTEGAPARLTSPSLASLKRVLERRPDVEATLELDARGVASRLPKLEEPLLEPGELPRACELPEGLRFGATLVDANERAEDPDPPPKRRIELPGGVQPLFEAVYAAPDDDGPRRVLADALLEVGHPRGRFIALQLGSRITSREEARLLEVHSDAWLGELTRLLTDLEWERGFPVAARLRDTLRGLLGRPELSTLERLDFGGWSWKGPPPLGSLSNLRVAVNAPEEVLAAIARGRFPRLEALHAAGPADALLHHADAVPALRHLDVEAGLMFGQPDVIAGPGRFSDAGHFAELWATPLARQLERFSTLTKIDVLPSWLRLAPELPVPALTLRVAQYLDFVPLWVRLDRGSRSVHARYVDVPRGYDDGRPTVELLVEAAREAGLEEVVLEHPHPSDAERALQRRHPLRIVTVPPGHSARLQPLIERRR